MIEFKDGDIFASDCEVWVNPVNCVGVMGAGLAAAFKQRFPEMFQKYLAYCANGFLGLGGVHCWKNDSQPPAFIFNVATKVHYSERSTKEGIRLGLENIASECVRHGIQSVAIPALGCGLGGLSWEVFHDAVKDAEPSFGGVRVVIYRPC